MDEFITTSEASETLSISIRRIQALINVGKIQAKKIGRDWLISKNELEERKPGRPKIDLIISNNLSKRDLNIYEDAKNKSYFVIPNWESEVEERYIDFCGSVGRPFIKVHKKVKYASVVITFQTTYSKFPEYKLTYEGVIELEKLDYFFSSASGDFQFKNVPIQNLENILSSILAIIEDFHISGPDKHPLQN